MIRVPEIGAMDDPREVDSYDQLSKKHLGLVERLFIKRSIILLNRTPGRNNSFVLDVGTGTANIPVQFAQTVPGIRFIALDLSLPMLKRAQYNIRESGCYDRILLVCADAEHLPFRDQSFDFVMSHSTMHHLKNPLTSVREIVRVTKHGNRFIVRDLRRPSSWLLNIYVHVFGWPYDRFMKKMYLKSLHAGFTFTDMKQIARSTEGAIVTARRFFITHVGLEGMRK